MRILSALDAISPAFSRTKLVLFSPYRVGRTWKLCVTAYLSFAGAAFLPFPIIALAFLPILRQQAGFASTWTSIYVTCVLMATLVYLVFFYLFARLRFAYFDIVLNRGEFVAPAWRKYGSQSFKWTVFEVLLGSLFTAVVALPIARLVPGLFTTFSRLPLGPNQPPSPEFLRAIFTIYAAFFFIYLVIGIFYLLSAVLADFVVPSLALEEVTIPQALHRFGLLLRREPGQLTLYVILKCALFLAGGMAVGIAFYAVLLIVALVAAMVGLLIGFLLHLLHVPTAVLTSLAMIVGIALYFGVSFYGMFVANGTLFTFLESYALYFLGGRYPMLGDLLDRSTPAPPAPPLPASYYAAPPPPPAQ
ncbi:MAG: hypothetical protein WBY53_18420 [Acidobacteriaceae bacterium]